VNKRKMDSGGETVVPRVAKLLKLPNERPILSNGSNKKLETKPGKKCTPYEMEFGWVDSDLEAVLLLLVICTWIQTIKRPICPDCYCAFATVL
jgi:hypothetical protein